MYFISFCALSSVCYVLLSYFFILYYIFLLRCDQRERKLPLRTEMIWSMNVFPWAFLSVGSQLISSSAGFNASFRWNLVPRMDPNRGKGLKVSSSNLRPLSWGFERREEEKEKRREKPKRVGGGGRGLLLKPDQLIDSLRPRHSGLHVQHISPSRVCVWGGAGLWSW